MVSCTYYIVLMFWLLLFFIVFFFKQKTAYEMRISDWSSDVCSSDLKPYPPSLPLRLSIGKPRSLNHRRKTCSILDGCRSRLTDGPPLPIRLPSSATTSPGRHSRHRCGTGKTAASCGLT